MTRIEGTANRSGPGGDSALKLGAAILVGDRIQTGAATRVEITFPDGTVVVLGDKSTFVVKDYRFTPGIVPGTGRGASSFQVLGGVFRAISGLIPHLHHGTMEVATPVATLGIRGTTFWGEITADRLDVALLAGTKVVVRAATGTVSLDRVGFGTTVVKGKVPEAPHPWAAERLKKAAATVTFH